MQKKEKAEEAPKSSERVIPQRLKPKPGSKRFSVQFDFDFVPHPGKVMSDEQQTVPDLNLTVRQLFQDHTRGTAKQPLYFEHPIPTIRDMTDVEQLRANIAEQQRLIEDFIRNEKKAKDEAENEKKEQERREAALSDNARRRREQHGRLEDQRLSDRETRRPEPEAGPDPLPY